MEALKELEKQFEKGGLEALLPQNLNESLLIEVCDFLNEFQNYTFDNESRAYREMQELINPDSERPYTEVTRYLLQRFCRIGENELEETLKAVNEANQSGLMEMFLTMTSHYFLEQLKRVGGVEFEPLPTTNNILITNKRSTKFKIKKGFEEEGAAVHLLCFKDDRKK